MHLGATSVDILDTAAAMRCRDAVRLVILPCLLDLQGELIRRTREEAVENICDAIREWLDADEAEKAVFHVSEETVTV